MSPGRETGPHKSHSNQRQPGSSGDFYGSSALERLQWKIGHSVGINEQFAGRGQGALLKKRVTKELSSPGIQLNNPLSFCILRRKCGEIIAAKKSTPLYFPEYEKAIQGPSTADGSLPSDQARRQAASRFVSQTSASHRVHGSFQLATVD